VSAIVWFRRDLRLHEHPALCAALASHDEVVPAFCFDDRLLHGRRRAAEQRQLAVDRFRRRRSAAGMAPDLARHLERFDPRGRYVRRYVPELSRVPDEYLAEPWTMPAHVQREAGCVIGEHYPEPLVDRKEARERALERYRL